MRANNVIHAAFAVALLLSLILGGCSTLRPSALNQDIDSIDISQESIALLTLGVANKYKPDFKPNAGYVFVSHNNKENGKKYSIAVEEKYNETENGYNEYLISLQVPPGEYKLEKISAISGFFPVIGHYFIPIYSNFRVDSNKIIYLGHIETYVKERTNEDDLRAGPVFPLIDQAATGASGGTFVTEISDNFQNDIKLFKSNYPYLAGFEIDNVSLPPWEQPTV